MTAPPLAAPPPDEMYKLERIAPPGGEATQSAHAERQVYQLRNLAAEVNDLRDVLRRVSKGEVKLEAYADYIKRSYNDIDELVTALTNEDAAELKEGRPCSDCIRHIQNLWQQMSSCLILVHPTRAFEPQEQMQMLALLEEHARKMVFLTVHKTAKQRLDSWLRQTQPGFAVPFHKIFEDEVPDAEDRQAIVDHLAWSPRDLLSAGGIIDAGSGLVYRFDPDQKTWKLVASLLSLLVIPLIGALLMPAIVFLSRPESGPAISDLEWRLVAGWFAVLVGLWVHGLVDEAKRVKAQGPLAAAVPVMHRLRMLQARAGQVMLRSSTALIVYLALIFTLPPEQARVLSAFVMSAFLLGYGLDSAADLFSTGLEQRAAQQQAKLKENLGA